MDKFKAMLLEGYLKNKFQDYIKDNELSVDLDLTNKKALFRATLVGEIAPISVTIDSFEIVDEGDGEKRLCLTSVSSDRAWLNLALNKHLKNKALKIPSLVASAL